jgi:hypothetical protein
MPRAKLRKGGKWHEQHRLCCVTHSMRVRGLQSGELTCLMAWSTSAGASVRAYNASEEQDHVGRELVEPGVSSIQRVLGHTNDSRL